MATGGRGPRDALAHLRRNRDTILSRSAVAAVAGMLPVPLLDEVLASAARTTLLRLIAESHAVDADEEALGAVAAVALRGALPGASLLATSRLFLRGRLRRLLAAFNAAGRAEDLAATFAVATLFDHYCARHHVGLGLDQPRGRLLAVIIERSVADARLGFARRGLDRAVRTASSAALLAPRALRGLVERASGVPLLAGGTAAPAQAEPVDPAEAPRRRAGGFAQRALGGIADLLGDAGRTWIEELTSAFDARWAATAAGGGGA